MADSTVYKLGGADGESFSTKRRTGWIPLTDMARNVMIRRLNARYDSADNISVKVYANGDSSANSEVWSGSLSSNSSSTKKYDTIAVGRRANSVMVEISTGSSTSTNVDIGKIEVEVDG